MRKTITSAVVAVLASMTVLSGGITIMTAAASASVVQEA